MNNHNSQFSNVQSDTSSQTVSSAQSDRDAWDALLDTPESREFLDSMKEQSLKVLGSDDEGELTEL